MCVKGYVCILIYTPTFTFKILGINLFYLFDIFLFMIYIGGEDGPSQFLIDLIDENGGTKPPNWQEYRLEK
jgi:hypothetical protein